MPKHCGAAYAVGVVVISGVAFAAMGAAVALHVCDRLKRSSA